MMNDGFFSMIQILSANPCIGRVSGHQGKKTEEQVKFQSNYDRFFNIQGIVHIDWVPEGQTFNQVYNKKVLTVLHERVRRKRLEMWKKGTWILHHGSALSRHFWRSTRYLCWKIHPAHLT
jgi:hypothetical protein